MTDTENYRTEKISIGADLARIYLKSMIVRNRNVINQRVQLYSQDMLNDDWNFGHQSIAFNEVGELQDGMHRMLAIIRADSMKPGIHVDMLVYTGPCSFLTIDSGASRNVGQNLTILGFQHGSTISGAVRLIYMHDRYSSRPWYPRTREITPQMIAEYALEHEPEIRSAVKYSRAIYSRVKGSPVAYCAAVFLTLRWADGSPGTLDTVTRYWNDWISGANHVEKDPRTSLTVWQNNERSTRYHSTLRNEILTCLHIRCLAQWLNDDPSSWIKIGSKDSFVFRTDDLPKI